MATERVSDAVNSVFVTNAFVKHVDMSDCNLLLRKAIQPDLCRLEYLDFSLNTITDMDAVKIAQIFRSSRNTLKHIYLSKCKLQEFAVITIADALLYVKFLHSLDISDNSITKQGAERLAAALQHMSTFNLMHLNVFNCFTTASAFSVYEMIKGIKTFQYVNLGANVVTWSLVDPLIFLLSNNRQLEYVNLSSCNFTEPVFLSILQALLQVTTIKCLNLASNLITKKVAIQVAVVASTNIKLCDINLSITKLKISPLFRYVENAHFLQHLGLSHNIIGEQDSKEIANFLMKNHNIKHLDFSWCLLSEIGVHNIVSAIVTVTSLHYLSMCSCHINNTSKKLLAGIITNNRSLLHLNLSKTKLQSTDMVEIAKALQRSISLKHLMLDDIDITNEAAYELSVTIKENLLLQHLSLIDCNMQEDGVLHITKVLQNVSSLKYLSLSDTIISDVVAENIAVVLSSNTRLEYLDFSNCDWEFDGLKELNKVLPKLSRLKQSVF
ncbi:protein NLRC3-like [Dysidea avara]|uniref:protein NLRC3-like n=1 Tax=Dysidea avara TaxID=196820 RepID=UPI00332C2E36